MKKHTAAALTLVALLSACASPHVVESVKTTDATLSCAQIDTEMKEAERFRSEAQKEKGVTGTNVAAVIFFWPAMIGTYSNANEAITAASARKAHLVTLYTQKNCVVSADATTSQAATGAPVVAPSSSEKKLTELNTMRDKQLITPAEYDAKRQKILADM